MNVPDPRREFAVSVVVQLRDAGFEALWAGGCVRDLLLGKLPKDYDVATTARPDEVRALFGKKRTVPVGASFGVIMVLGPTKPAGQIEVATFRTEGPYLDGRRPERVDFCTPEEDAKRRDFTINGMFYDPVAEIVHDYVGGENDLRAKVLRAIGQPVDRMTEDKLRMLRAVRFAATLEFDLDRTTAEAVRAMAPQIHVVSAERIAQELRRMLVDRRRRRAMELGHAVGLIGEILPEVTAAGEAEWNRTLQMLESLREPTFELSLAALLHAVGATTPSPPGLAGGEGRGEGGSGSAADSRAPAKAQADRRHQGDPVWTICRRLKLSNEESEAAAWLVAHRAAFRGARQMRAAELKRKLSHPLAPAQLELARIEGLATGADLADVEFAERTLRETPAAELNPPPLLSGNDLIALGIPAGPAIKEWLDKVRDGQLNGEIATREAALAMVRAG